MMLQQDAPAGFVFAATSAAVTRAIRRIAEPRLEGAISNHQRGLLARVRRWQRSRWGGVSRRSEVLIERGGMG
jgi:hypothetical protein